MNKKIIVLALAAFTAAFGAYRAFAQLAQALEKADFNWDEAAEEE